VFCSRSTWKVARKCWRESSVVDDDLLEQKIVETMSDVYIRQIL
jgi:hypothetical protein